MSQKRNLTADLLIGALMMCTTCGLAVHALATGDETSRPVSVRAEATAPTVQTPEPEETVVETPAPVVPIRRNVVVKAAILCWNEANDSHNDAAAIVHMRMRSARSRGRTLEEELYYLHGDGRARARNHASLRSDRATNPRRGDSRAWLGDVTADLHKPLGWPGTDEEWVARAARINALYDYIERVIDGHIPDPCRGRALRWGGGMDHALIEMWKARGEVVLNCGGTMNTFLGRR
jgi:hypothetical protein